MTRHTLVLSPKESDYELRISDDPGEEKLRVSLVSTSAEGAPMTIGYVVAEGDQRASLIRYFQELKP